LIFADIWHDSVLPAIRWNRYIVVPKKFFLHIQLSGLFYQITLRLLHYITISSFSVFSLKSFGKIYIFNLFFISLTKLSQHFVSLCANRTQHYLIKEIFTFRTGLSFEHCTYVGIISNGTKTWKLIVYSYDLWWAISSMTISVVEFNAAHLFHRT